MDPLGGAYGPCHPSNHAPSDGLPWDKAAGSHQHQAAFETEKHFESGNVMKLPLQPSERPESETKMPLVGQSCESHHQ